VVTVVATFPPRELRAGDRGRGLGRRSWQTPQCGCPASSCGRYVLSGRSSWPPRLTWPMTTDDIPCPYSFCCVRAHPFADDNNEPSGHCSVRLSDGCFTGATNGRPCPGDSNLRSIPCVHDLSSSSCGFRTLRVAPPRTFLSSGSEPT